MSEQDRGEIVHVLNLCGLAIDARRWDLFDLVFTPDVSVDYPLGGWTDLPSFNAGFERMHEPFHHTQHAIMNHLVTVSGDSARAFSYVAWRLVTRDESGEHGREGSAWYDDDLVRTQDGWRIGRRSCRVTWVQPVAVNPAAIAEREAAMPTVQVRDLAKAGAVSVAGIAK